MWWAATFCLVPKPQVNRQGCLECLGFGGLSFSLGSLLRLGVDSE